MYWRLGIATLLLAGILGCTSRSRLFRTPYDKELRAELRKKKGGWVVRGPEASVPTPKASLEPGQFFRLVLETPQPITEETAGWLLIRMDTVRVMEDSLAYIPWAGSLRVGGMPLDSARLLIEAVAQRIFVGAKVRLYPLYPYYIFGNVPSPGRVLLDRMQVSLLEVLPLLQPQSSEVDFSRIKVIRGAPTNPQVWLIDARDYKIAAADIQLQTGDILVAELRGIIRARQELQNYFIAFSFLQVLNLVLLLLSRF